MLPGSCSINYGFMISIFKIEKIEDGIINDLGEAVYTVTFKAMVFRPYIGEVTTGKVKNIEKVGMELSIGTIRVFIPHTVSL